jgi:hypothetical protein
MATWFDQRCVSALGELQKARVTRNTPWPNYVAIYQRSAPTNSENNEPENEMKMRNSASTVNQGVGISDVVEANAIDHSSPLNLKLMDPRPRVLWH